MNYGELVELTELVTLEEFHDQHQLCQKPLRFWQVMSFNKFYWFFSWIQVKGKRIPIHLLPKVKLCIDQLLKDGHIKKLSGCSEVCFISLIVITAERDGPVKLALNSTLLNRQIFRNRCEMPNLFEHIDNVAVAISGQDENKIWFPSIDLKYTYSQLLLSKKAGNKCNFIIVGEMLQARIVLKLDFTD